MHVCYYRHHHVAFSLDAVATAFHEVRLRAGFRMSEAEGLSH